MSSHSLVLEWFTNVGLEDIDREVEVDHWRSYLGWMGTRSSIRYPRRCIALSVFMLYPLFSLFSICDCLEYGVWYEFAARVLLRFGLRR